MSNLKAFFFLFNQAPCYALRDTNVLLNQLGFFSSVNNIFYHILAISSHITQQLIVFIGGSYCISCVCFIYSFKVLIP